MERQNKELLRLASLLEEQSSIQKQASAGWYVAGYKEDVLTITEDRADYENRSSLTPTPIVESFYQWLSHPAMKNAWMKLDTLSASGNISPEGDANTYVLRKPAYDHLVQMFASAIKMITEDEPAPSGWWQKLFKQRDWESRQDFKRKFSRDLSDFKENLKSLLKHAKRHKTIVLSYDH